MIRLTGENVQEYITKYVPKEYQPGEGKLVFGIFPIDIANLALLASTFVGRNIPELMLGGVCINSGMLLGGSSVEMFDIFIKEHYESEEEIAFVILHEVGHVDWWVNEERRKMFKKEDNELYADLYAFERITDVVGMEKALDALCHYASASGFGKELSKDYNE